MRFNARSFPGLSQENCERICSFTPLAHQLFEPVSAQVFAAEPASIGFPDARGISTY